MKLRLLRLPVLLPIDKQHFDQLVKGVEEMKRHIAGKTVRGAVSAELPIPDIHLIREVVHISQGQFAKLIATKDDENLQKFYVNLLKILNNDNDGG